MVNPRRPVGDKHLVGVRGGWQYALKKLDKSGDGARWATYWDGPLSPAEALAGALCWKTRPTLTACHPVSVKNIEPSTMPPAPRRRSPQIATLARSFESPPRQLTRQSCRCAFSKNPFTPCSYLLNRTVP